MLLYLGCVLTFLTVANAASVVPATTSSKKENDSGLIPLREALTRLEKTKKSPSALKIKKAWNELKKDRISSAQATLAAVKNDPLFSDYYPGLLSEAYVKRALGRIAKNDCAGATADAQRAMTFLNEIELRYPSSPFQWRLGDKESAAEVVQAQCMWKNSKSLQAQKTFERAFSRVPAERFLGFLSPSAIQAYAESCTKKDQSALCMPWLRKIGEVFPKVSPEGNALTASAPVSIDLSRVMRSYERLTQQYKVPDADQAAMEEAIQAVLSNEWSTVREKMRKFLVDFPRSGQRSRARYWLAQAYERDGKGNDPEVKNLYEAILQESPLTYYGLLSSFALNRDLETLFDPTVPLAATEEPALEAKELARIKRAEKLFAAKALDAAADELREIPTRVNISSEYLVYIAGLAGASGADLAAFQAIGELIQRKHPGAYSAVMATIVVPRRFENEIQKVSQEKSVDPLLVMSLIKQETSFVADSFSSSNALGLMQLMPFTAVAVDSQVEQWKLFDPQTNINIGTQYLSDLIHQFNGNIAFAIASYNGGPHRVSAWLKDTRLKQSLPQFIEGIKYKETRDYVLSILRHYALYSYFIQGKKINSFDSFWMQTQDGAKPESTP